jgi:hypothetical protein
MPDGLGPLAAVTKVDYPAACITGSGTGALAIGPAMLVAGDAIGGGERQARGCVPFPLTQVWQALQEPSGVDVAFWPDWRDSDCQPRLESSPLYAVNFVTKESTRNYLVQGSWFDVTWRMGVTQGLPSAPTEVKILYGKTAGASELARLLGSVVLTVDPANPGWTRIDMVRTVNSSGWADDPTRLRNWLQDFYDGLRTQLATGSLAPRYCGLP